jgi:hypothetical protein
LQETTQIVSAQYPVLMALNGKAEVRSAIENATETQWISESRLHAVMTAL